MPKLCAKRHVPEDFLKELCNICNFNIFAVSIIASLVAQIVKNQPATQETGFNPYLFL